MTLPPKYTPANKIMGAKKEQLQVTQENIIGLTDFISKASLFERAAKLKKLELFQNDESFCLSKPIAKLPLNEGFKKSLTDYGFKIDNRRPDGILTIVFHEKRDNSLPIKLSDWWNIRKGEKPSFVLPEVDFTISNKERGILLQPHVTFSDVIVSPGNQTTHNRMAEVISSYYQKTPSIFKEMVQNNFKIIIPWKEIDAAGARTLYELFDEWAGGNKSLKEIAHSNASPFKPSPHNYDYEEIWDHYLPEQLQGNLFAQWKKQLDEFKRKLP